MEFEDKAGKLVQERVRVVDFDHPEDRSRNRYLAVSQLWIKGVHRYRRPDVLLYVNGLPLVFVELKNSNIKLKAAFDDNLTRTRRIFRSSSLPTPSAFSPTPSRPASAA